MNRDSLAFWLTVVSSACWLVCFWWMYRISSTQNALLARIQEQSARIEKLSKEEHELIKEVHPQVGEIAEKINEATARKVRL